MPLPLTITATETHFISVKMAWCFTNEALTSLNSYKDKLALPSDQGSTLTCACLFVSCPNYTDDIGSK